MPDYDKRSNGHAQRKGSRFPGVTGAVLTAHTQEWVHDLRRGARGYLYTTTFVLTGFMDTPNQVAADPLTLGFRDAADECRHGNLPPHACGCW